MKIPFYKYQGTGNDFVMIDNRATSYLTRLDTQQINWLCDRRFGIGADGLILLQEKEGYDFEMVYFNADGRESSMCGNGGRCIVAFARFLGVINQQCTFLAVDGPHEALIGEDNWVELKMKEVKEVEKGGNYFCLDTGSPHYVTFVENLKDLNVVKEAHKIRYSDRFKQEGINVNFVKTSDNGFSLATYERGVEDETLSCGTGVTAAAIAYYLQNADNPIREVSVQAKGGQLKVRFQANTDGFSDIWLCGPAQQVFAGMIEGEF